MQTKKWRKVCRRILLRYFEIPSIVRVNNLVFTKITRAFKSAHLHIDKHVAYDDPKCGTFRFYDSNQTGHAKSSPVCYQFYDLSKRISNEIFHGLPIILPVPRAAGTHRQKTRLIS